MSSLERFIYGKNGKDFLKNNSEVLLKTNVETVLLIDKLLFASFAFLAIISMIVVGFGTRFMTQALTSAIFFVLSITYDNRESKKKREFFVAISLIMIFVYATCLSAIWQNGTQAIMIVVFYVAMPYAIIMSPIQSIIIEAGTATIYLVVNFLHKAPELAIQDAIHVIPCVIIGIILGQKFTEGRIETLVISTRDLFLKQLYGRKTLEEKIDSLQASAKKSNRRVFACMIDVDNFKHINDLYGHDAGDEVLRGIAERLIKAFPEPTFFPVRYGGDEMLVFSTASNKEKILSAIDSFRKLCAQPIHGIPFTVSIGYAFGTSADVWNIIKKADIAAIYVKRNGKDAAMEHDSIMMRDVFDRRGIDEEHNAIKEA